MGQGQRAKWSVGIVWLRGMYVVLGALGGAGSKWFPDWETGGVV